MSGLTLPNFKPSQISKKLERVKQKNLGGLRTAALYGVKPHMLGFCGPQEKSATRVILKYLSGKKVSENQIREILEKFEAAFCYYKLIAKSNKIKDPFNERVVKAYWIGNKLLDNISIKDLKKMVVEEFSRPGLLSRNGAEKKAEKILFGLKPHHSFHVLVVGSVTGRISLQGKLLDLCRINSGEIIGIDLKKNQVKIKYQPLKTDGKYRLGKMKEKNIIWQKDLFSQINTGQQISFHWDQAVQILTENDAKCLQKYTQQTLNVLNSAS